MELDERMVALAAAISIDYGAHGRVARKRLQACVSMRSPRMGAEHAATLP